MKLATLILFLYLVGVKCWLWSAPEEALPSASPNWQSQQEGQGQGQEQGQQQVKSTTDETAPSRGAKKVIKDPAHPEFYKAPEGSSHEEIMAHINKIENYHNERHAEEHRKNLEAHHRAKSLAGQMHADNAIKHRKEHEKRTETHNRVKAQTNDAMKRAIEKKKRKSPFGGMNEL